MKINVRLASFAAPLTLALVVACGDEPVAPEPTEDSLTAAEAPGAFGSAKGTGLQRHIETYAGTALPQSNFDLTLTCPSKMIAVGGGFEVGADNQAAELLISEPVAQLGRWRFLVYNPHLGSRDFEVHVVCLR